jgi:hypothetical protein
MGSLLETEVDEKGYSFHLQSTNSKIKEKRDFSFLNPLKGRRALLSLSKREG